MKNAVAQYRAGILIGHVDMLTHITEQHSAVEISKQLPGSHMSVRIDRDNTSHMEVGEFGSTDFVRLTGLLMQRLAMLRPPDTQEFQLLIDALDNSNKAGKDLGIRKLKRENTQSPRVQNKKKMICGIENIYNFPTHFPHAPVLSGTV